MDRFAIIVEFELAPGAMERFLPLIRENAARSLSDETGCDRFDVLTGEAADRIVLYEVYRNRAAFDLHATTPHYLSFAQASEPLVRAKRVTVLTPLAATGRPPPAG